MTAPVARDPSMRGAITFAKRDGNRAKGVQIDAFENPIPESVNPSLPAELLARSQWVAWWSVVGEGRQVRLPNGRLSSVLKARAKPHKLPINSRTGGLAATTRSNTWSFYCGR